VYDRRPWLSGKADAWNPTKKLPWREQKEKYLAHLRSTKNKDVLLVTATDKLHTPVQLR
jgi:hypothetical protein